MTLSSKTTRRPGWSLTTCLHLYGQSISVAFQRNILSQTDRGSTGKKCAHLLQDLGAAAALPPRGAHFPSLMFGLTGKTTTFPSSTFSPLDTTVYISIITDPGRAQVPRHTRPLAELLAAIARLLDKRQLHNAPSLHIAWTIQQKNSSAKYHILEVLNYELTTPTPAAWSEIFERRLSLREEQQLQQPHRSHIPLPWCSLTVRILLQTPTFATISAAPRTNGFCSKIFLESADKRKRLWSYCG